MPRIIWVLLGGFILQLSACTGQTSSSRSTNEILSAQDFEVRLSEWQDPQLLDVRRPDEFARGHIAGATNIDVLNEAGFREFIESLDKEKPVMVYCQAGVRSRKAAYILEESGFRLIYDLEGGYRSWPSKR
jgi:rhodanese-related sulfurtransferase